MVNQQQAVEALTAWTRAVDAAHAQAMAQAAPAPGPTFLESVGEGVEDVANGAASLGQAALANPGAVVELAGGLAAVAGGYALATGGVVVSATGVGAIAGVPAAGAGFAVAAAGGVAAMDGARRLAEEASLNPAAPIQMDWKTKNTAAQDTKDIQDHQRRSADAHDEQMENLNKTPKDTPPLFRQQEKKKSWW